MARGLAKVQAKEKAAKKASKAKGQGKHDHKAARDKQLKMQCTVCKAPMSDKSVYKQHFEAKHSKLPLPDELK
eukprot:m.240041 g.240041  ORF g.240041 m.240041 type:complete len:73 (+) comp14399_c0_seq1:179-397(+)